ncbi:MAG: isopentenyl phosphate kinase [Candidatus Moranbacteria bacterium]|nr:isopentenyl phosphate kinase [Candidatus Moranbacteria bacterium]
MKPLYILKLGGSVVTDKDKEGFSVKKGLIDEISREIKNAKEKKDFDLILIHGAGAAGHQLAMEYKLVEGTGENKEKIYGALLSQLSNQKLNREIFEIFLENGLDVTPIHTASTVVQAGGEIAEFNSDCLKEALKKNFIPLLYGEMVFDKSKGMSICSGDSIAPHIANKLGADRILYATDVDGIYTQDPYQNSQAELIEEISYGRIKKKIKLSSSHNIDTTGGLKKKILRLEKFFSGGGDKTAEIFNGNQPENFSKILLDTFFKHTKIEK